MGLRLGSGGVCEIVGVLVVAVCWVLVVMGYGREVVKGRGGDGVLLMDTGAEVI